MLWCLAKIMVFEKEVPKVRKWVEGLPIWKDWSIACLGWSGVHRATPYGYAEITVHPRSKQCSCASSLNGRTRQIYYHLRRQHALVHRGRIRLIRLHIPLAGSTEISELNASGGPLEGCPWPCLKGVQGRTDGNSLEAKFSFPSHVALSANTKTLFVTDQHVIRSVLDLDESKVDTIAGTTGENELDGFGSEAGFNKPEGVTVTSDGYIYISDSASCRIRRAFYAKDLLPEARCSDSLTSVFMQIVIYLVYKGIIVISQYILQLYSPK